ncbi:2-oxoacid:acceptor oxidoreductase subunit alpha [Acidobacteriota bacterium]
MKRKIKPTLEPGAHFMMGDVACAEGAIAAGCRYFAGYPITPSSEVMVRIVERFPDVGGVFVQMEDEIGSISSVMGAVWAGAKGMTATSGPGLSLMMETVGFAVITETPCVIVDIQRAGPSTGQATRPGQGDIEQVKWGSHGDCGIIAVTPWSVQEMFTETVRAFNLAERFRVPVFVLADEAVGHMSETIIVPEEIEIMDRQKKRGAPPFGVDDPAGVPPMPSFGEGEKILITGSTHDPTGRRKTQDSDVQNALVRRLNEKVNRHAAEIEALEFYKWDDAEIGFISFGISARSAAESVDILRQEGIKAGLLRLRTMWPFPEESLKTHAAGKKILFVPEMNLGQLAREVSMVLQGKVPLESITKVNGEVIRVEDIVPVVQEAASRMKGRAG